MSHLTIDITNQQHQSLKAWPDMQSKTTKQYVLEELLPGDSDANQAWEEIRILLGTRIHEALVGNVSAKNISEILDEELNKRSD